MSHHPRTGFYDPAAAISVDPSQAQTEPARKAAEKLAKEHAVIPDEVGNQNKHTEFYHKEPHVAFYDQAYHDMKAMWDLGRPQPKLSLFLAEHEHMNTDATVLEVGCGTGEHVINMASVGHRKCMGIDASEKAIHDARLKATSRGVAERVEFKKFDCRHLKELSHSFDIVLDVGYAHTLPDEHARQSYADQLRTVLYENGRLYMLAYSGDKPFTAKDIYNMTPIDISKITTTTQSTDKAQAQVEKTVRHAQKQHIQGTSSSKPVPDDEVIVPTGMSKEEIQRYFSADKGWRVDRVIDSIFELANGSAIPAHLIKCTFIGPKLPATIPQIARDTTNILQGVPTAKGDGAIDTLQEQHEMKK